jgi:hypothetical protein
VGKERKEIHMMRPTLLCSCLTLFHHPTLVNFKKQAVIDIKREERLRER